MASRREGYRSKRPKPKRRRTYQYVTQDASPPLEDSPPRPPRSYVRRMSLSSPPGSWRAGPDGFAFVPPGDSPDPDDDPVAAVNLAALPDISFDRRERMNHDVEYSGSLAGGNSDWTIPIPTVVGIARGDDYNQRATFFVRVSRLAFKITALRDAIGSEYTFTVPPFPDSFTRHNVMYFRFAVIYDKQSRGVNPTSTYPDVFASGPAIAINQFRLPATTKRYEILHDATYRWANGELTSGSVEVAPAVAEPFWVQNGLCAKEEIFVDCDKLVRYSSGSAAVTDVVSGNIFYMLSSVGGDCNLTVTSRTTYSDNL